MKQFLFLPFSENFHPAWRQEETAKRKENFAIRFETMRAGAWKADLPHLMPGFLFSNYLMWL